ncbi:3-oxoacyl-[acyl-carrier protein] reductase [Alteribacillus persepolensis]|uniref:3-oxoacyl-[acyl-carrier protein] reductase n=1 Tax=Alteribacillus persepolensis TaxID=568899 RepID=A0A1G8JCI0_9BACI|nr:SDR family NAD(P)-dependent oxidoreductase [Alteribacillus persepolensis]SDI28886.1 3-oxoacyl-[acyl-carrier protein] reductase [Alteribacillus persepolensis]
MNLDGFGRVAIVTGAAQGLGKSIAFELLEDGKRVVFVDINFEGLKAIQEKEIAGEYKKNALFLKVDVRNREDIFECVEKVLDHWGRIDILVNNAGIRKETQIDDITDEEWELLLSVNLTGTFKFSQAVIQTMRDQQWGRIINISSYAGQSGPLTSGAHYSASKAGQLALTKVFARELAKDHITVNAIAPAVVKSPEMEKMDKEKMNEIIDTIPIGRIGEKVEVSKLVLYLSSEFAIYITGATFDINGGLLMR